MAFSLLALFHSDIFSIACFFTDVKNLALKRVQKKIVLMKVQSFYFLSTVILN